VLQTRSRTKMVMSNPLRGKEVLTGLIVAGAASNILTTVFGVFHVGVFLSAYKLSLSSYATGNAVYSFINTANDVAGAWLVDSFAARSSRSSTVGVAGILFALCFLSPFFRWRNGPSGSSSFWDTTHFVVSLSLYDTMYSFTAILFGSMFTDNHNLNEDDRIGFMAVGKFINIVVSFLVVKFGLNFFSTDDLGRFRSYVLVLALLASVMFILAQRIMHSHRNFEFMGSQKYDVAPAPAKKGKSVKRLELRLVIRDFVNYRNFRFWVIMEMLLECQTNFRNVFMKMFIDNLLHASGLSGSACNWLLSCMGPLTSIAGFVMYLPIRKFGYQRTYLYVFRVNIVLSSLLLFFGSPGATPIITAFLVINSVLTAASSSGFNLAMSDMVADMKLKQIKEGRFNEPSLAGIFMGANALVCKPMDSLLPIAAAWSLAKAGWTEENRFENPEKENENNDRAQWALFYLLVLPPLFFSVIQHWALAKYDLVGPKPDKIRRELKQFKAGREAFADHEVWEASLFLVSTKK